MIRFDYEADSMVESADGDYVCYYDVKNLQAERDELQKCLKEEKKCQIGFAIRMLGQEAYDNSPCQAHPLELIEFKVSEILAEHKRLISRITDKAIRNRRIT